MQDSFNQNDYYGFNDGSKPPRVAKATIAIIIVISVLASSCLSVATCFIFFKTLKVNTYAVSPINIEVVYDLEDDYHIALAQSAIMSVVDLRIGVEKTQVKGTGVIVGKMPDTSYPIIMTNRHVLDAAISPSLGVLVANCQIGVRFAFNGNYLQDNNIFGQTLVTLLGYDTNIDIALISVAVSIDNIDDLIITFANSNTLLYGQSVMAIGNALGNGLSVTEGLISLPEYTSEFSVSSSDSVTTRVVQHTAPINSGNSGGALIDYSGRLVGINTYTATDSKSSVSNIAYAVPANNALAIMQNILRRLSVNNPKNRLETLFSLNYVSSSEEVSITSSIVNIDPKLVLELAPQVSDKFEDCYISVKRAEPSGAAYKAGIRAGNRIIGVGTARFFDEQGKYIYHNAMVAPSILVFEELFFYYGSTDKGLGSLEIVYLDSAGKQKTAVIQGAYLQEIPSFLQT